MSINIEQVDIGIRFELPTKPGHFFVLDGFARPAKRSERVKAPWVDRLNGKVTYFVKCKKMEATHVHGWESYACFLTIVRLCQEGNLMPEKKGAAASR